jgi:hypothetical protein
MGLDDVCSDFVSLFARGRSPVQSVNDLLEWVEIYSDGYPSDKGSQLDAMRRAAKRVQRLQRSGDQNSLSKRFGLALRTGRFHWGKS